MNLDIRTLLFSILVTTFVSLIFLWAYNLKTRDKAIQIFIVSQGFAFFSYLFVVLRNYIPDVLSLVLGNLLLIVATGVESLAILQLIEINPNTVKKKFKYMGLFFIIVLLVFSVLKISTLPLVTIATIMLLSYPLIELHKKSKGDKVINLMAKIYIFTIFLLILRMVKVTSFSYTLESLKITHVYTMFVIGYLFVRIASTLGFILISKEKSDRELFYFAKYDNLTDLPNRRYFLEMINTALLNKKIKKKSCYFLLIDIDYFKSINDNYGHSFGDIILSEFGKLLKSHTTQNSFCCRYGGEEFAFFIQNVTEEEAKDFAESLRKKVDESQIHQVNFTISIGISSFQDNHEEIDELFRKVDSALYYSKNNGRNQVSIYV